MEMDRAVHFQEVKEEKIITDPQISLGQSIPVGQAPVWPRTWKAYAALISGFFMMFNCWLVSDKYLYQFDINFLLMRSGEW